MVAPEVGIVRPRPRVAVALGGGGARGYAHIGVLDVLGERGYDVVLHLGDLAYATGYARLPEPRDAANIRVRKTHENTVS